MKNNKWLIILIVSSNALAGGIAFNITFLSVIGAIWAFLSIVAITFNKIDESL